ncbi:MAG: hypothetical protein JWQ21_3443 [Herminiimonas sp.]|nr:hypothetical protein [Herminiimonas sp.]
MQPKTYICFTPAETSSVSALFHVESGMDIYGWRTDARGHCFSAAFFMLESFYATRGAVLYRSVEDDVYGPWITDFPLTDNEIRCPLPELVRHELERLQSQFVEEWLFFENDPAAIPESAVYRSHRLPVQAVNIRSSRLNRLGKNRSGWEYSTSGSDLNIIDFIEKYWRFNEKAVIR